MPPEVHIPGSKAGMNKKWVWVIAGVGAGGLVLYIRKNRQAAQQNSASPTDSTTSTDSSGIDPNTGVPYVDETGGMGVTGSPYSQYPLYGQTTTTPGPPTAPTTNGEWARAAEKYLIGHGYHANQVTVAIARYLAGLGLNDTQYNIVLAALAFQGNPPTNVPAPHKSHPDGGQHHRKHKKFTDRKPTERKSVG